MQGISGRSHILLLQVLNNVADGSLRLALRVKSNEKKETSFILPVRFVTVTGAFILLPSEYIQPDRFPWPLQCNLQARLRAE